MTALPEDLAVIDSNPDIQVKLWIQHIMKKTETFILHLHCIQEGNIVDFLEPEKFIKKSKQLTYGLVKWFVFQNMATKQMAGVITRPYLCNMEKLFHVNTAWKKRHEDTNAIYI